MTHRALSRGEFLALTGLLAGSTLLPGRATAATPKPPPPSEPECGSRAQGGASVWPLEGGARKGSARLPGLHPDEHHP
jgi:hypothetical protein